MIIKVCASHCQLFNGTVLFKKSHKTKMGLSRHHEAHNISISNMRCLYSNKLCVSTAISYAFEWKTCFDRKEMPWLKESRRDMRYENNAHFNDVVFPIKLSFFSLSHQNASSCYVLRNNIRCTANASNMQFI